MKKVIKSIVFIILFCAIWKVVFSVLWIPTNSIGYFYKEQKNTLDVIYIGASNVYCHFNSVYAYNLYGFTTGMLTSSQQPISASKYLLKEADIHQNPEVYVIDIGSVAFDVNMTSHSTIRSVTDEMKYSKNRIETINGMLEYSDTKVEKKDYYNFYYSFMLYHNSWKNITHDNFGPNYIFKGFFMTPESVERVPQETYNWSYTERKIPEDNLKLYLDLIKYIKSNDLEVIFVVPIRFFSTESMEVLNTAIKIARQEKIQVINFNDLEDFSVDFTQDFFNANHLNVYGSLKYTAYFSKYLMEHYKLNNHKNDEKYNTWKNEFQRFENRFEELTGSSFNKTIKRLKLK